MRTGSLLASILVFSILLGTLHMVTSPALPTIEQRSVSTLTGYVTHAPIVITSNGDFEAQGWPGNGTLENPYVIEGLGITADSSCIYIYNTTVYFEIRDCLISSAGESLSDGIRLDRVTHGTVRNCIIDLHRSGIELFWSSDCTLMNNTASSNKQGFEIYHSSSCLLTNNTATNNSYGFFLVGSDNCTLMNNTLVENGFVISEGGLSNWLHDIAGNSVNGKPLGYFRSVSDLSINGSHYGQVILANCSDIVVRDGTFICSTVGIQLGHCMNCTLINNTAAGNTYGFLVTSSDNCTLANNIAANTSSEGFELHDSNNCMLAANTATNDSSGFGLRESESCVLTYNIARNNSWDGFYLGGSDGCVLTHNTAIGNSYGFILDEFSYGCVLMHNIAANNSGSGFAFYASWCTLAYNTAANNSQYGVYLQVFSRWNTVYQNQIGYNNISNARDDGRHNSWDDGVSVGNYWSDYSGWWTYAIPGSAGSVDRYPFHFGASNTTLNPRQLVPIFVAGFGFAVFLFEIIYVYSRRQR